MPGSELAGLIGPLRFASRNGFAGVERLRGFEALVRARVDAARRAGEAEADLLDALLERVKGFDAKDAAARGAVIREVVALLGGHLALPAELGALAEPGAGEAAGDGGAAGPPGAATPAAGDPRAPKRSGRGTSSAPAAADHAPHLARDAQVSGDGALAAPVSTLPGVGPSRAHAFEARGVSTVADALWFLPVSWERRVHAGRIADLAHGTKAVVAGTVETAGERFLGARHRKVFEALVTDGTGRVRVRYYHRAGWVARRLTPGTRVVLSGPVRRGYGGLLEMAHPELLEPEAVEGDEADEVIPRYPEVEGVPPRTVRRAVAAAVVHADAVPDPLPPEVVAHRALMPPGAALRSLHLPPPGTAVEALNEGRTEAHHRLVYEEFFFLQLGLALKARGVKLARGIAFPVGPAEVEAALRSLPWPPTGAQRRVVEEIAGDMARAQPMNRLLQGDVGSGKTAVAAVALSLAVGAGWQGAVMAPTELLAEQHAATLGALLAPAGIRVVRLTGSLGAAARREAQAQVAAGTAPVVVGTHALIQEGVDFHRLGLVVVDEQHRFGVRQRMELMEKGTRPDVLVMTATPIPRTLAMTAYGDLDLSILDEMPPGRTPVATRVYRAQAREKVYDVIRREVGRGHQAYVVYPLVEVSENLEDVQAATEAVAHLQTEVFPELTLGLLHGKMPPSDKDRVMGAFSAGRIDVLVATTVIEVGIDVPNASVMVVEHAERFGLSQLHQLRGRVGRGAAKSHCLLVAEEVRGERVRERLRVMEATTDGFRIAEEDLRIRGPGEILGTRQSGHPDLLFGNLARDRALLAQARADAFALIEADPHLQALGHRPARSEVVARWGGRLSLGQVG